MNHCFSFCPFLLTMALSILTMALSIFFDLSLPSDYFLGVFKLFLFSVNRIGGVMGIVITSSAVDRGFESRSDHTKD